MKSQLFPKSTFAQLPEGCCEFSKHDIERIRCYLKKSELSKWIPIYEAIAPELLKYRNKRKALVDGLYDVASSHGDSLLETNLSYYEEKRENGTTTRMTDICPFSVLATFSLETKTRDRWPVARALGDLFNVKVSEPKCFHGVPTLPHRNPRFYKRKEIERREGDIDVLWNVFAASAAYADKKTDDTCEDFIKAFNAARAVKQTKWNLTIGLYWSNPTRFLTLDRNSREYIRAKEHLNIPIYKRLCFGGEYVVLMDRLQTCFAKSECPFNNFPELSRTARKEVDLAGDEAE